MKAKVTAVAILLTTLGTGCGGVASDSQTPPPASEQRSTAPATVQSETASIGEEVSVEQTDVEITSAEVVASLEKDPTYSSPGSVQGPFMVVRAEFTNNSQSYLSPVESFTPYLQTSSTERMAGVETVETLKIQPDDLEPNADAAPGTTRDVVYLFEIEEGEEPRFIAFKETLTNATSGGPNTLAKVRLP